MVICMVNIPFVPWMVWKYEGGLVDMVDFMVIFMMVTFGMVNIRKSHGIIFE